MRSPAPLSYGGTREGVADNGTGGICDEGQFPQAIES